MVINDTLERQEKKHEQILGRPYAGTEDGPGAERCEPRGENGFYLSSHGQEHLGVRDHYNDRRQHEVHERKSGPENVTLRDPGLTASIHSAFYILCAFYVFVTGELKNFSAL